MFKTSNIGYLYDKSFDGLLCCVFESFERKETPIEVKTENLSFLPLYNISTDSNKARRVLNGISVKICKDALDTVKMAYLSNKEGKEIAIIKFLQKGFKYGSKIINMLSDNDVIEVSIHARRVVLERQRLVQFVRFSDCKGVLISIIEPENNVLPILGSHFKQRFPCENFMIYDKTGGMALIHIDKKLSIIPAQDFQLPAATTEEFAYRKLWRLFYDTIEIKERHNERCRMNFMPKKFWKNMTEFMTD